jgi:hypothetical protein
LVKTSAINSLIHSSKKSQRVNISRRLLLYKVAAVVIMVVIFLICWMVLDAPTVHESRDLSNDDPHTVDLDLKCASESDFWILLALGWQFLLLLMAAVLAFQSRNILKQFNESTTLGAMVYSHFLFMALRGVFAFFDNADTLPSSLNSFLFSINYSLDTIFAMVIYVLPKLANARKEPQAYRAGSASIVRSSKPPSLNDATDANLNILACTANLGNAEPTLESMEAWIPPDGACDKVTPLEGKFLPEGSFDLIAIGFQESTWKESKRVANIKGENISEDEILNALEEHDTAALREMIQDILGDDYSQVVEERRGQMRLHLWASNRVVDDIKDVKISGANTGIGNMLANKGGIVVTLNYKKTRMTFLSAHLAAHEGKSYYDARCDNIRCILRDSKTFVDLSSKLDVAMTSHHMFVMGDLNFRTRFEESEDSVQRALDLIQAEDYKGLYEFDELHKGIQDGDLLVDFQTLPCLFPPTFKVQREAGFVYKKQRTPSYTDRILFKSAAGLGDNLEALAYEPCVDFITSDHKPVRGAYSIVPNEMIGSAYQGANIRLEFSKLECSDLPVVDSLRSCDPYLMCMWDSVDLSSENTSVMDTLRKLAVGKSFPRTKWIPRTLHPKWEGERFVLTSKDATIGPDAMLFLVVKDFAALIKDYCLCAVAMNVHDITSMKDGETKKTLLFDEPLQRNGRFTGRIKFQLDIELNVKKPKLQGLQRRMSAIFTSPSRDFRSHSTQAASLADVGGSFE